jgi:hypothetical protein
MANLDMLYKPLDPVIHQIRLIRMVKTVCSNDVLTCDMRIFSLDEHPVYKALSYAWCVAFVTELSLCFGLMS